MPQNAACAFMSKVGQVAFVHGPPVCMSLRCAPVIHNTPCEMLPLIHHPKSVKLNEDDVRGGGVQAIHCVREAASESCRLRQAYAEVGHCACRRSTGHFVSERLSLSPADCAPSLC